MKLLIFLLIIPSIAFSARLHSEKYYQLLHCKGQVEYVLEDRTRVDCLTDEYAIEFDFPNKWPESISQAIHYSIMTGKKPAIALIMENPEKDWKYLPRLYGVIMETGLKIKVFYVTP